MTTVNNSSPITATLAGLGPDMTLDESSYYGNASVGFLKALEQLVENATSTVSTLAPTTTSINGSDHRTALDKFSQTYQGVHGYFSVAVCVFGIISNVLNIIVLTRKHMRSPTNLLLTALAIADMLTMSTYPIFAFYFYILNKPQCWQLEPHPKSWIYFIFFHQLFIQMCHTVAMYLTVALAVFRYIFVCRHQIAPTWCSMARAKITVVSVTSAAIFVCVPQFFLYQVKDNNATRSDGTICRWWITSSTFAEEHPIYLALMTSVFGVIMKIAPCILLSFLSGLLIHAMQQARQRRARLLNNISRVIDSDGSSEHNRTTMMMVGVVLCFVITETPQGILALWAAVDEEQFANVYVNLGDLMDILVLINSAVNFILYCIMSQQFRNTFKSLFVSKHIPSIFHRFKTNTTTHHVNGNEYASVKTETTHV